MNRFVRLDPAPRAGLRPGQYPSHSGMTKTTGWSLSVSRTASTLVSVLTGSVPTVGSNTFTERWTPRA